MAGKPYGAIPSVLVAPVRRNRWGSSQTVAFVGLGLAALVVLVSLVMVAPPNRVVLEGGEEETQPPSQPTLSAWPGPYTAVPYMHDPRSGVT